MKLKKIFGLLLMLIFILNIFAYAKVGFSPSNVYMHTKELSLDKYKGRLVGDSGNHLARSYIEKYFKQLGLKPGGDNGSFLQSFDIYAPNVSGDCYFKVLDGDGKLIKEYKYGEEFKEMTYGASIQGRVSGNLKTAMRANANIMIQENINSSLENPRGYTSDFELQAKGIRALIVPADEYIRFRSPYKLQKKYDKGLVKIYASREILPELLSFAEKNYSFELQNPVKTVLTKGNNVIGILKGRNKSLPPLILSAHYDHVGFDMDGTIYPGSLDNASGTGFLLECARVLSGQNGFERTIVFVAFDGEEVGLIGSKYFSSHPPMDIREAECINFDMVGSSSGLPISIIYSAKGDAFANEILSLSRLENIPARISANDSSDHAPFCSSGIKAVTLIQYDVSKIHTPNDTMDNISEAEFQNVYRIFEAYLSSRNTAPAFLTLKSQDPTLKFLLPGALILIAVTFGVLHLVEGKKE